MKNYFQKESALKKIILDLISKLQMLDFIESNYRVLSNGLYHQVNQLTPTNISKSFIFFISYEKINVQDLNP